VINGIGRIGYMKGGKSALFRDEDIADDLVRQASRWLRQGGDEPFFLWFSASDIHAPRWPHSRFRGKSRHGLRGDAMVSFDWSVGAVLDLLDELGVADNTIVILSSDNGPVYVDGGYQDGCETRGSGGADHGHDASGPYRGGKYQIYEGGTRVPFIVRWPGRVEPGVSSALVSQVDLLASFAEFLGVELPEGAARDSRSCFKALTGTDAVGAEVILECSPRSVAIRRGSWKYVEDPEELYDLSTDPGETLNRLADEPGKAAEMKALLDRLRRGSLRALELEMTER
jgi:arylsulfatase A-like enzyme